LLLLDGIDVSLMVDLDLCFVLNGCFKGVGRSLCVLQFYENVAVKDTW
jgi:hypothetical protein